MSNNTSTINPTGTFDSESHFDIPLWFKKVWLKWANMSLQIRHKSLLHEYLLHINKIQH